MLTDKSPLEVAYYINLPHRTDRKERFEKQAKFLPVKRIERFEAVDGRQLNLSTWPGTPGALGVRESHIQVLEAARKHQLQKFFIFEDDAVIKRSFKKNFYSLLDEIGDDWDMIYLYAKNHYLKPLKISSRVIQLQNTLGLVGVAYNARHIDMIIDKLKNDYRWVDSCMADLHVILKVYAPSKSLVFHPRGYSDNEGVYTRTDRYKVEVWFGKVSNRLKTIIKKLLKL